MNCPLKNKTNEEDVRTGSGLFAAWHRLWCAECRKAHAVDSVLERGAAQWREEAPPPDSLARTLAALGMDPALVSAQHQRQARRQLGRALFLVGTGIFITTLAQPGQIGKSLFETPQAAGGPLSGLAGFWAFLGLFWYLKPLAALLLETVPALKSRRRLCLIGTIGAAALLWLAPLLSAHALGPGFAIALNALLAFASTILGGYLVEQAQQMGASGRLGALHQAALNLGAMAAPLFGLLAGHSLKAAPLVAACLLLALGGVGYLLMPEEKAKSLEPAELSLPAHLKRIGRARDLWNVALMMFLVFGVSSFDALLTAQQARQQYTEAMQNQLLWIGQAATFVAILLYIGLCRRIRLQSLLPAGILANAGGTLLYLGYGMRLSPAAACGIEIANGLAAALIVVTLFDLAVRAVPVGSAYLGYAILMSANNLSHQFSNVLTAWLHDSLHLGFTTLICLSAVSCTLSLLVLPMLPSALVRRREGEPAYAGQEKARVFAN